MSNNNQVHGHAVIDFVAGHPGGIQRQCLADHVFGNFGPDVRFCTCSAEGMTLDQLLVFLAERSKIFPRGDVIFPGSSPACDHGEDHQP